MRVLKALLKFLAGTLAVLVAGELVLQLLGYGGLEQYVPDSELLWKLRPGQRARTKVGHYPVQINSLGLRSPEFACERDTNTFRVVALGDSYTFGWGVRQDETYPAYLQSLLQQAWPHRRVEVWNAGCNGYSMVQEAALLRRLMSCRPDMAVVGCSFNEGALFDPSKIDEQMRARIMRGVRLKNVLRRSALYNFVVEMQGRAVYMKIRQRILSGTWGTTMPEEEALAQSERQLREVVRICRENNVAVILLVPSGSPKAEAGPFQQRMLDVAAKDDVPVVNMVPKLAGAPREKYWIPDGHPNAAGQRATAEALAEQIVGN